MGFKIKIIAVIVSLVFLPMFLQAQSDLPLHQKRLNDRALVVWTGDYMQSIATVALATSKGIVVIETSLVRSDDARIRRAIEEAFGRNDFKYLINTHYNHDHTAGNQVYSDATIVGHKNVPAGMKSELTGEGLVKQIEKFKAMLKSWEERLQHAEPGSRDYNRGREGVALLKIVIGELQDGFTPTYPSILFEKSLILDMGDMTVELYSFAGIHTDSDIVIFVPEEGLVAVGDMPPDRTLPYLRKEMEWNLGEILENWSKIVDSGREIKHVNMAHSDMFLSVETFKEQYKYFKTLWDGLREMQHRGLTIEDAKKNYTIEKDFPYFKDMRLEIGGISIHEYNLEAIWDRIAEK
jgi:glyoxylase-like metal-dependent hydrolase (beta-lactamase superfamily II)